MSLDFQNRFNEHIQKIFDIKGRRIDSKTWEIKDLSPEDRAELERLEATIPENEEVLNLIKTSSRKKGVFKMKNENKLEKKRKLTPIEQKRIQKYEAKYGAHAEGNGLLKVVDRDGEEFIAPFRDTDLSQDDRERDLIARLSETSGYKDPSASIKMLARMASPLLPKDCSLEESVRRVNEFGNMMREFEPSDAIESALCSQIIVCQERGMSLLASAGMQMKSPEWAKIDYNASSKLLARAQSALERLIAYRKKGQTITVQHLHAEPGSQIAVGHFESHQRSNGGKNKNTRGTL